MIAFAMFPSTLSIPRDRSFLKVFLELGGSIALLQVKDGEILRNNLVVHRVHPIDLLVHATFLASHIGETGLLQTLGCNHIVPLLKLPHLTRGSSFHLQYTTKMAVLGEIYSFQSHWKNLIKP